MASWGTEQTGDWKQVTRQYDAQDEVVDVQQRLWIGYPQVITEQELLEKVKQELQKQPEATPLYVETHLVEASGYPTPHKIFDLHYQYASEGLLIELIILAIFTAIILWLGIEIMDTLQETVKVISKEIAKPAVGIPVTMGAAALLLLALFLLAKRRQR